MQGAGVQGVRDPGLREQLRRRAMAPLAQGGTSPFNLESIAGRMQVLEKTVESIISRNTAGRIQILEKTLESFECKIAAIGKIPGDGVQFCQQGPADITRAVNALQDKITQIDAMLQDKAALSHRVLIFYFAQIL